MFDKVAARMRGFHSISFPSEWGLKMKRIKVKLARRAFPFN